MFSRSARTGTVGVLFAALALTLALMALPPAALANTPVTGAAFTTVNEAVDGTGHCQNGNPNVNCNIYDGKQYVWLNGGPSVAYVGDGSYFFAVLVPGGQADPNDGAAKNLSDLSPTSNTGAGDAYTNRIFTVTNGVVSYNGTHDFNNNKIRLMPYDDTTNPGGVYIMAICSLADGYPVDPSDCKYDAFKVEEGDQVEPPVAPTIIKDAAGSYDKTYSWTITKDIDGTSVIKQSDSSATFNYTVVVSRNSGTVSNVTVSGDITVFNPNLDNITGANVTDAINDANATCTVTGGSNATLAPGDNVLAYSCTYSAAPLSDQETNTATVTWPTQTLSNGALAAGNASFNFDFSFTVNQIDDCVSVVDDNATPNDTSDDVALGTTCSSRSFTYSHTVTGVPGTCTIFDNTATFTTNTTSTTGSASASAKLCVGQNLEVSKTANPAFKRTYAWTIAKRVDKTLVKQVGGTATFYYSVDVNQTGFTDSEWVVKGTITVNNPNDWQSVALTSLSDAVNNGGSCSLDNPSQATASVPANSSITANYTCTYATTPSSASGTNTATASWDKLAAYTPDGSAQGMQDFSFTTPTTTVNKTIQVTDTFNGTTTTLGTLTATDAAPFTSTSFTYPRTIAIPTNGCVDYPNTATIVQTGQTASQSVRVCGPIKTGALTMGFWQNPNGQNIIKSGALTGTTCQSATWLRQYAPFQDLGTTVSCAQVATYVTNVIKAANASGAAMNAMLKAQMLATALDVYFSDPALGGNKISAPAPIGGVTIDLTKICKNIATCSIYENVSSAFGGATSKTVSDMLAYAASQSNSGGTTWYGQVKATQELAKDAFDAINNEKVFAP